MYTNMYRPKRSKTRSISKLDKVAPIISIDQGSDIIINIKFQPAIGFKVFACRDIISILVEYAPYELSKPFIRAAFWVRKKARKILIQNYDALQVIRLYKTGETHKYWMNSKNNLNLLTIDTSLYNSYKSQQTRKYKGVALSRRLRYYSHCNVCGKKYSITKLIGFRIICYYGQKNGVRYYGGVGKTPGYLGVRNKYLTQNNNHITWVDFITPTSRLHEPAFPNFKGPFYYPLQHRIHCSNNKSNSFFRVIMCKSCAILFGHSKKIWDIKYYNWANTGF